MTKRPLPVVESEDHEEKLGAVALSVQKLKAYSTLILAVAALLPALTALGLTLRGSDERKVNQDTQVTTYNVLSDQVHACQSDVLVLRERVKMLAIRVYGYDTAAMLDGDFKMRTRARHVRALPDNTSAHVATEAENFVKAAGQAEPAPPISYDQIQARVEKRGVPLEANEVESDADTNNDATP